MSLLPLQIPPGVYANGTDVDATGRWHDASLVRWHEGSLRPVGGWADRIVGAFTAPARGMHAWQDNTGDRWLAAGTADKLYVVSASNVVSDISPVALVAGDIDAVVNTGYGYGFYGLGAYGTERPDVGNFGEATSWSLDNFGEFLVAANPADGRLFQWNLAAASPATVIAGAPINNAGLVVTEERFLFALGAGGNPRLVQWADRETLTDWTPAATNEAGDIELQTSGQIMCGVRTRGATLILTDTDAHVASYLGPPFVYGFNRIGTSCGAISRKALVAVDAGAFWMGQRGFYRQNGQSVDQLPCDVYDRVFGDLNRSQASKCWAVANSQFSEIWFFYPSGASNDCDRYASFNYQQGTWSIGALSRSSGVERGVFRFPLWASLDGTVYEHEKGLSHDGSSVFAETGPVSLGAGDQVMCVTSLIPDELTRGDVTMTFKTRFHPNDVERSYGPYTMDTPSSVRFTGRQVRMRIESARLADWHVGVPRLEVTPGGRR